MEDRPLSISALYYYPVKSCAGIRVERGELLDTGLRHDRELLVVDAQTSTFLTQRQLPRLALITPALCRGRLSAAAPGMAPLEMPLVPEGEGVEVTIWKDRVESVDQGPVAADWFSRFLDHAVRVVRKAPDFVRRVDPDYATAPGDQVGFADGYPLLLLSEASLDGLNRRLAAPLPMERFRPNIVITGCPTPHHEDSLRRFRLGSIAMSAVKPCARCVQTTVDQQTAAVGKEPLRTLAQYRKAPRGVMFGMNVIHHATGWLAVGERLAPERACTPAS